VVEHISTAPSDQVLPFDGTSIIVDRDLPEDETIAEAIEAAIVTMGIVNPAATQEVTVAANRTIVAGKIVTIPWWSGRQRQRNGHQPT
jgi:hypothetical protein